MDNDILSKAYNRAINGGIAGMGAMAFQVGSLMWLRTTMNYQFRNGGTFQGTITTLYKQGGIPRFYRGVSFALMQAPLSRFGDTAMNLGFMSLLENKDYSLSTKTLCGSLGAGFWRIIIMPIDTFKTNLQVNDRKGMSIVTNKIRQNGPLVLYHGAFAQFSSTVVGHFPWFLTYNYLSQNIQKTDNKLKNLGRSAIIGFCSSSISDICSNSLKVIKTNRQTSKDTITYQKLIRNIIHQDSVISLFTRGLKTKIITNGLQGMMFTIIFDYLRKN
jgi:hypothetical protein